MFWRGPWARKGWVLGILLGVGALVLFSTGRQTVELFSEQGEPATEPDTFVNDSVYVSFTETGRMKSRLEADRALHYPHNAQGIQTNPVLTVFVEEGGPWRLNATRGRLFLEEDRVLLTGFVTVTGSEAGGIPLRFDSPAVEYEDRRQFIHTDQPVTINSRFNQVTAIGMEFDMVQRKLRLLSEVEGIYVDPR